MTREKKETGLVKTGEAKLKELNNIMVENLESMKLWANKFPFPVEKTRRMLEIEQLPLDGVNFIPQKDSSGKIVDIKFYINSLGASVKAEQKALEKDLELAGVKTELIESDKQAGRVVVKATLLIRDKVLLNKIVDKAEKLSEKVMEKLLEACMFKYEAFGSHSFIKETNPSNKEMSSILKKSETQAVRRANLRFAPPYIFKADEISDSDSEIIEGEILNISNTKPTMQDPVLTPSKVEKIEEVHDKPEPEKKKADKEEKEMTYEELLAEAEKNKISKGKLNMWLLKTFPNAKNTKELTSENIQEAMSKMKTILEKKKGATPNDEVRGALLRKIFAVGKDKAGFEPDALRSWVKDSFDKGLSEMDKTEMEKVIEELNKI